MEARHLNVLMLLIVRCVKLAMCGCNHARSAVGGQLSTCDWAHHQAYTAYDGNLGTITHTVWEAEPWLWLDLGRTFTIQHMKIYNRQDGWQHLLTDVYVGVTLEAPGTPVRGNYPLCATHPGTVGAYWELACQTPMRGRYIIVQLGGANTVLSFGELEVYRSVPEGSATGEGVPGLREEQEPLAVLYVRALIECIATCLNHQQCVSVNYAADCDTGSGCCELLADLCPITHTTAPGWTWVELI